MLGALSVFLGDSDARRSGQVAIGRRIIARSRSTAFSFSIMSGSYGKPLLLLQIFLKESLVVVLSS